MKKFGSIVVPTMLVLLLWAGQSYAEGNWWGKGLDVFKSLGPKKTSDVPGSSEIGRAFKQALRIGSENVVGQLGAVDGFNGDSAIHIPLPKGLSTVKSVLGRVGMSGMVDDLELKLNRAAEAATPRAKQLFLQSITEMTFDDVQRIYKGSDDSATRYFQEKMTASLSQEMRPIVENSLLEVGAVQAFDSVMGNYQSLPFVPDVKADLTNHVVNKGMEGIFYYLAKEEAAIRQDPVKQTTNLLKKVFGAK